MSKTRTVLFLCPHGAAKSVLAAAYCRRLVEQRGLDIRVDSAGTLPDAEISPAVVELLKEEGIEVTDAPPRRVGAGELATADWVVSLGCDVQVEPLAGIDVVRWDDVPPVSVDPRAARDAIRARVENLVSEF